MLTRMLTTTALALVLAGTAVAQQQDQEPQAGQPVEQQAQDQQPAEEQATGQAQQEGQPAGEQPAEQAQQEGQPTEEQPAEQAAASIDFIKAQEEGQMRAGDLLGMSVVNQEDEEVGEVTDLLLDQDQKIIGVVLGVGGLLGVGEKEVAVPVETLEMGDEMARVNLTSEQLEEAPSFATLEEVKAAEEAQQAQQQMEQQQQQLQQGSAPAASE